MLRFRIRISMHACMNKHACVGLDHGCAIAAQCTVAGAGTNIAPAFTTRKHARVRHWDQWKCSCVHVVDPRKQHVLVYENVQTIISWLLPAFKGFYDTHAQLTSVSYKHAKRRLRYMYIRKQRLAHFSYTETVTCMRVLHNDEISFTSMDAILKRS